MHQLASLASHTHYFCLSYKTDGMSHSKLANLTPNSCQSHYFGHFKVERSAIEGTTCSALVLGPAPNMHTCQLFFFYIRGNKVKEEKLGWRHQTNLSTVPIPPLLPLSHCPTFVPLSNDIGVQLFTHRIYNVYIACRLSV